ncbi:GNAT family N-acetyltransferase [Streptomyces sp. NPDC047081]|uniref:GNAT family N-acetyltransferase n=1 Tax=Streptomyces sp. NPDC047081 TaxID=3154706 RepID=UPI00340063BE
MTEGPLPENVTVRPADPGDLPVVAELRYRWVQENGDVPLTVERADFISHFTTWAQQNSSSHRCLVLVRDTTVIGMAWLAILPRVPSPRALHRASGDVQCVYVIPEARNTGLGGHLMDEILSSAHSLGLERVTVHSSPRAIPAYARHGFKPSPRLLQSHMADHLRG